MKTLVTSYVNPDLDGYGGSYAYAELLRAQGVDAMAAFTGTPLPEVAYVLERFGIAPAGAPDAAVLGRIVLVDAAQPHELDPRISLDAVVEIIDHHEVHYAQEFPNAQAQIELVGAAATLVAERFRAAGATPSAGAAALLLGGIISNSLNFQSSLTGDRDRAMAAWLTEVAGAPGDFARALLIAKSDLTGAKLGAQLAADSASKTFGGVKLTMCQLEIIGSEALAAARLDDLLREMLPIKLADASVHVFLGIVDLEKDETLFVAGDEEARALLAAVLPLRFEGAVARHHGRILRKQVWPLLKARLEA